jgi:phenylalanyl-tRNA synthetase alpha chain
MLDQLQKIKTEFENDLSSQSAEELKRKYLGKESELLQILGSIPTLAPELRKDVGKTGNEIRGYISTKISELQGAKSSQTGSFDEMDVTLPGVRKKLGKLHPHTLVMREMNEIFKQLGFSVYAGPEIETDEYVFERLNLPKDHPARSLQDTLMIEDPEVILRSHTSSVEIRAMETEKLPIRIVVPGRAFRYEDLNQTNHFAFFQYEGLAVGENITLADLKGTFESFARSFFGSDTKIRIRAKYYPQVEPGCGLDIQCKFCEGKGCPVCKKRGWIEASGGGMVHPNALRSCGIDPKKYSGFAWGMGFDRIVMQKYGITDIRRLFDGTLN